MCIWSIGNRSVVEESSIVKYDSKTITSLFGSAYQDKLFTGISQFIRRSFHAYALPFTVLFILSIIFLILKFVFSELVLQFYECTAYILRGGKNQVADKANAIQSF